MKKYIVSALLVSCMLMMYGCGEKASDVSSGQVSVTENDESSTDTEETSEAKNNYVHGEEGYYNIADELPEFQMRSQEGGTCWLYSGVAGMETAYAKKNGKYLSIEPLELLELVYGDENEEGFVVKDGADKKELGGWQWMITERLASGFDGLAIDSSVVIDQEDRDAIKENIRRRGGISVGTLDRDHKKGWNGGYYTMNDTHSDDFDHDICIIGWDDHFPKEYFNEPASEDGAWITYNSSFGSVGFYYVSYCTALQYAVSQSVTDKYSEVLSYDAGNEQGVYIETGESTTTANVFHKSGTLAAIGTYNDFDRQDIKIEVYDPAFTELLYSQEAVLDYKGYHTIELDTPLEVSDYAVSVTYSKGAPVEGEDIDYGSSVYKTVSEKGKSFVRLESWKDLTDDDIKTSLDIDFEPNNCCIKALYA